MEKKPSPLPPKKCSDDQKTREKITDFLPRPTGPLFPMKGLFGKLKYLVQMMGLWVLWAIGGAILGVIIAFALGLGFTIVTKTIFGIPYDEVQVVAWGTIFVFSLFFGVSSSIGRWFAIRRKAKLKLGIPVE